MPRQTREARYDDRLYEAVGKTNESGRRAESARSVTKRWKIQGVTIEMPRKIIHRRRRLKGFKRVGVVMGASGFLCGSGSDSNVEECSSTVRIVHSTVQPCQCCGVEFHLQCGSSDPSLHDVTVGPVRFHSGPLCTTQYEVGTGQATAVQGSRRC